MADGQLSSVAAVVFAAAPDEGRLGSAAIVVFHGPVPPATLRLPRTPAAGRVWLLELDLGPEQVYFATRAIELPSRVAGGARRYAAGLPALTVEAGAEDLDLSLPVAGFDALRARHGSARGRPAVLRLWRGEAWVEDAEVVLRGVVGRAAWGRPSGPDALDLSIVRPAREASRAIVPPGALLDRAAWPSLGEGPLGEHAPVVIGRPGSTAPLGSADRDAYPASPAHVVDETAGVRTFVVAAHHVAAANVSTYDLTDGAAPAAITSSIVNTVDWLGREVATIAVPTVTIPSSNEDIFVAWAGGGGGAVWRGRELRGLGTLLEWGAITLGRGQYDLARIASAAAELDEVLVDVVLNDPSLTWDAWVDSVADVLGVEVRESPTGTYYAPARWVPRETEVRATLGTAPGDGGFRVVRRGPLADDDADPLASEVTVYYAQHGEVRWPRRVTYAAAGDPADPRVVQHPACAAAAERGGEPLVVYAPTSDPATAWQIARTHVERHAVSAYLAEYTSGPELGDVLRRGDTVEIYDGRRRLGVVRTLVLGERTTRVLVRIPD